MKINKRKFAVLGVIILVVMSVAAIIRFNRPPTALPTVRLSVLGYRKIINSGGVFPGRWIIARVELTNEGSGSLIYEGWGANPFGWVRARTAGGQTNGYMAPPFTGMQAILRPKRGVSFDVWLPAETLDWQCGFDANAASARDRATWACIEHRLWRFQSILLPVLRLFSDKEGPVREQKSDEFMVFSN